MVPVGSSPLSSFIGQSSKNSGAPVSNIWSPRKRSPRVFGAKNDLAERQLPTLDAFKIVPYPALDSQLLQIIFSPKTLLEKMTKDVKNANDASILFEMPKKIADDVFEVSPILGIVPDTVVQEVNFVETPKIAAEELNIGKSSETPTNFDEIINIVHAEPTILDVVEDIDDPKTILIEEVKINPIQNEDAQINTESKISSEQNEAVFIQSPPIDKVGDEISTSSLQSPPVTKNEDDLESSVIVGNPSNLLINESSEIMKKVAEMPDTSVAIDDCGECHDCDNIATEVGDLEMASNENAPIQSENIAAIDPISEVETVAEVVPVSRRTRGPQAAIIAEPISTEKQDATEKYGDQISESTDEKEIDHLKSIEKLAAPIIASKVEEESEQEDHKSIEKPSVPIISSAEEKEIEQKLNELSIEETELPKISSAEEKEIEQEVDELFIDKTLTPKISPETAALSIVQPALFSKNVKRQIGNDMKTFEIVRPAPLDRPMFMNNLENETSSEKRERVQKSLQRMMHFVTIVGHVDSYLTKRFRSGVRTFARLCESGEGMRFRQRRSRFSS